MTNNFPPFYPVGCVPNPSNIVNHFKSLVRQGQTDFQFATIWEQRKTRQAIVEGFKTLGEAIDQLSNSVEVSVRDLQMNLVSELNRLSNRHAWQIAIETALVTGAIRKVGDTIIDEAGL